MEQARSPLGRLSTRGPGPCSHGSRLGSSVAPGPRLGILTSVSSGPFRGDLPGSSWGKQKAGNLSEIETETQDSPSDDSKGKNDRSSLFMVAGCAHRQVHAERHCFLPGQFNLQEKLISEKIMNRYFQDIYHSICEITENIHY